MFSQLLGLFDKTKEIITLIIILAIVFFFILLLLKFKNGKYIVAGIFSVVLIVCGVFSGYADYEYFSARGGIFGSLSDVFNTGNSLYQDNLKFNFSDFNLVATGNPNEYSARFSIENTNTSMRDKMVIANNSATNIIAKSDNYIFVEYSYTFYNENLVELCSDTLSIKFVFNTRTITDESTGEITQNDFSYCLISTNGGLVCAKYWNKFVDRNNFIVEIKTNDYVRDIVPLVDELPSYTVNFYLDNVKREEFTQTFNIYSKNALNFPFSIDDKVILSWKDSEGNVFNVNSLPYSNIDLYAYYSVSCSLSVYIKYDEELNSSTSYGILLLSDGDKTNSYGLKKDKIFNFTELVPGTYTISVRTTLSAKSISDYTFELSAGQTKMLTIPIYPSSYSGVITVSI